MAHGKHSIKAIIIITLFTFYLGFMVHLVQRSYSIKDLILRNVYSYSSAQQFILSSGHCASDIMARSTTMSVEKLPGRYALRARKAFFESLLRVGAPFLAERYFLSSGTCLCLNQGRYSKKPL